MRDIEVAIHITNGKVRDANVHDVNVLGEIVLEAGSFYVTDRGDIDFERLFSIALLCRRPSLWCVPRPTYSSNGAIRARPVRLPACAVTIRSS